MAAAALCDPTTDETLMIHSPMGVALQSIALVMGGLLVIRKAAIVTAPSVCPAGLSSLTAPLNISLWWNYGSLILSIHYTANTELAFLSLNHGKAPGYLADLCVCCGDTRLRSSSRGDFVVQRTRLRLAEKSFSVAGPRAWNSLSTKGISWYECSDVRYIRTLVSRDSFSRHLKTHFSSSPTTLKLV